MSSVPGHVRIVEVGPRDGLQNESVDIDIETRVELILKLEQAGLSSIEAGSFVSPKWVPQMAGSDQVFARLPRNSSTRFSALTPNMKGLEAALEAGVREIAVFGAVSESFSQKNINCSIAESLERFEPVVAAARAQGVTVRGYTSCVLGCPIEGPIEPQATLNVARALLDMGCFEVSLGDTIGTGTAGSMKQLLETLLEVIPAGQLAVHCHDTYGQALANILTALNLGIATVDASVAGLGGCPYARGASGNVATENVVYMLEGMGIETGIDLPALIDAGRYISAKLGRDNTSAVARAYMTG